MVDAVASRCGPCIGCWERQNIHTCAYSDWFDVTRRGEMEWWHGVVAGLKVVEQFFVCLFSDMMELYDQSVCTFELSMSN